MLHNVRMETTTKHINLRALHKLKAAAIVTEVRKDLVLLMKECARTGYQRTQGVTNGEFERDWREAFSLTESESLPVMVQ
jgi:hypothetical protein